MLQVNTLRANYELLKSPWQMGCILARKIPIYGNSQECLYLEQNNALNLQCMPSPFRLHFSRKSPDSICLLTKSRHLAYINFVGLSMELWINKHCFVCKIKFRILKLKFKTDLVLDENTTK